MTDALTSIRTRNAATPQSVQADPRQERNHAGGFTFTLPGDALIHRFLTLGTTGGTYYVEEKALTREATAPVLEWARHRAEDLVRMAAGISVAGRAPRSEPALFAVMAAMALGDDAEVLRARRDSPDRAVRQQAEALLNAAPGRHAAEAAFGDVVRTGTHLFTAAGYTEQFRGWGPVARRAFAGWFTGKDAEALAYQLVKYRQRKGWTHRDILRLAHSTKDAGPEHRALFDWLCGRETDLALPKWVTAYERAREIERDQLSHQSSKTRAYVRLIEDYPGLPWEALPDEATGQADVWRALVEAGMPVTALLRNLPKLTRLGVLAPRSAHLGMVTARLRDQQLIIRGRVHPVAVLIALKTYACGRSLRGGSSWVPVPQVTDALDDMFYLAFGAVEPSGKRTMLAVDVSGSMTWPVDGTHYRGLPAGFEGYPFTSREVVAALALVTARTEPAWGIYGFSTQLAPLAVSPGMRLDAVMRLMSSLPMGGTDCAAPMTWAARNRVEVDTFVSYTDNETWFGQIHPHEALENYRQVMGIDARLQVVGTVPTRFSIARPADPRELDVSGFDSAVPNLLSAHARGEV